MIKRIKDLLHKLHTKDKHFDMIESKCTSDTHRLDRSIIDVATKRAIILHQLDKHKEYGPLSSDLEELEKELIKEHHEFVDYLCDFFSIPKIDWDN